MSEQQHHEDELSPEELEKENGELLPDREEMTVVKHPWEPVGPVYTQPIEPPAIE